MNNRVALGKSLMKIMNKRGPKMDPWGTPKLIGSVHDSIRPNLTNCDLVVKYDLKKLRAFPLIPYLGNFRSKVPWSTESKALARSKKMAQELEPLSRLFSSFSYISNIAYSVEKPSLNPNWSLDIKLFVFRKSVSPYHFFKKFS